MRFHGIKLLTTFALLFVAVIPSEAKEFTLGILGEISGIYAPQISPDGDSAVIMVSRPDYESLLKPTRSRTDSSLSASHRASRAI